MNQWCSFVWYLCYYQHMLRDSASSVFRILCIDLYFKQLYMYCDSTQTVTGLLSIKGSHTNTDKRHFLHACGEFESYSEFTQEVTTHFHERKKIHTHPRFINSTVTRGEGWTFSKKVNSPALTVWVSWCLEGLEQGPATLYLYTGAGRGRG